MKDMVLKVLRNPITRTKISFKIGSVYIGPSYYRRTESAIENDDIEIKYVNKKNKNIAKYSHTHNRMVLGFKRIGGNLDREPLILHELTHAAHDIRGIPHMRLYAEAAAYIAQQVFFYFQHQSRFDAGETVHFSDKIGRAAWGVSHHARKKGSFVSDAEAKPLFDALRADKLYKNLKKDYEYDGV